MKNFLNKIYVFSKLSIILVLICIIIFLIYLLFRGYTNQSDEINIKNQKEQTLIDLIDQNSAKIDKLNFIIESLNNNIIKINENIEIRTNNDQTEILFGELKSEINSLTNQVENIQKITENSENKNKNIKLNNANYNNISKIVNLMKLKFENGNNFSQELNFLGNSGDVKIISYVEKMYILNNLNFQGNEKLLLMFQDETNDYISNVFIGKNDFIRPLLPFIEVKPSNSNDLNEKVLISLKQANNFLIKRRYEKTLMILKSIDNHEKYFKNTLEQLGIGKDFYKNLNGIINDD